MNIYNNITLPFVQFSLMDFKQALAGNGQKYAKIVAVALAIFAAAAAIYFLVKRYQTIKLDDPKPKSAPDILPKPPLSYKKDDLKPVKQPDTLPESSQPSSEFAAPVSEHDEWIIAYQIAEEADALERAKELEKAKRDRLLKKAKTVKPQPFVDKPQPVEKKPQPVADQPQLVEKKPQPVADQPQPVEKKAEPVDEWALVYQIAEEAEALERANELQKAEKELLSKTIQKPAAPAPLPLSPQGGTPLAKPPLQQDPLHEYTAELAGYIDEILSKTLAEKTRNNLTNLSFYLRNNNHKHALRHENLLYQSFVGSYKTLCEFFRDKEFPLEKKMEVLERLEAERHQCLPGQAGLLNDICNSMDEPVEKTEKLPWLIARYKIEVLRTAFNSVNSLNNVIKIHGNEFGLPAAVIKGAQAITTYHATYNLSRYYSLCTPQGCLDFLENFINSDLPGKDAYRSHILGALAEKVTDEQVDDKKTHELIIARHEAALKNAEKVEKERHSKKFNDTPDSPEAAAEWEKIMKTINLKKNPFIDPGMYANYHYRLNPEDSEDNKLTPEAIKLFADEAVNNLHQAHAV